MSGAADYPESLAGMTWPSQRTLYRFFVVWGEDDPDICCLGAEAIQAAVSTTTSRLVCLECGEQRHAGVEVVEVVI